MLALLAISDAQRDLGLVIISLFIIGLGVFLIVTPAAHLIVSDQRASRWLKLSELKTPDERNRAITTARYYYRCLGAVIVAFGFLLFCAAVLF